DWHAQAAMAVSFTRRTLEPHPMLWAVVLAEYGYGLDAALALQEVSVEAAPEAGEGRERLITDALVANLFRGRPGYRQIADVFDIGLGPLARRAKKLRPVVLGLRDRAIAELLGPMRDVGLTA